MAYQTGQREILYDFFNEHPHQQFSAKEIAQALSEESISVSAIYRNLAAMSEDGTLRCFVKPGSREKQYQFVNSSACKDCIHLSCIRCGKIFHMSKNTMDLLLGNLTLTEGFQLSKSQTIMYGTCKKCTD